MSFSSEPATLTLSSQVPNTLLSVFDGALRPIASKEGELRMSLEPGVYRIQGRVGSAENTQLIMLAPGAEEHRDLTVEFAVGAPANGTRTVNETHGELTRRLSSVLAAGAGPESGAVLILRTLRDSPQAPLDGDLAVLLDSRLRPVSEWSSEWIPDPTHGTAIGRCGRLTPGPYLLRTGRTAYPGSVPGAAEDRTETYPGSVVEGSWTEWTDQTVWLCAGWQTLVFLPNTLSGPDPRGASVHMVPLGEVWEPWDPTAVEVEAALAGLRDGVMPAPEAIDELANEKDANPMLAILALHRERDRWKPSKAYTRVVRGLLDRLRPAHPDVLAAAARLTPMTVPWPPMLRSAYRHCLLPADAEDGRVLPAGSPAERVAAALRPSRAWLQWAATQDLLTGRYAEQAIPWETWGPGAYELDERGGRAAEAVSGSALEEPAPEADPYRAPSPEVVQAPGTAVNRVSRAVNEIAALQKMKDWQAVERLGSRKLARRFKLPEELVLAALRDLGLDDRTAGTGPER
ncbi:hypothetical protein [Streptomyces sp. NPDC059957]|uniref:hypothetical protein n=1 Tax=unclassified Streptomyces TaxID=2593676 RepID=UPI003658CCF9